MTVIKAGPVSYTHLDVYKRQFLFLPVTLGNVRKPGETRHIMGSSIAVLTSTLVFALVLLQGSFGLGGYEHKNYPVIDFMAGIQIPGNFLQRVDVFFVAAVGFSLLFGLGSVFFYQHELLVRVKMEKTALFAASGMMAAAIQMCIRDRCGCTEQSAGRFQ